MSKLVRANIPVSAKQAAKSVANGTYVFDAIFQRSLVWEQKRKSALIHSLIEGYPVPPFYAQKVDGYYSFLDGKQRMNTIKEFINNEFYLIGIPEVDVTAEDGTVNSVDINGKFFDNLPEELQDAIKDYHLTVYYYDDISPEQVRMLFAKLNNGKPLSTKERNIANCVDIITVSEIGNHELFSKILTEKALNRRKQIPMVMKIWMMLFYGIDDVSFASIDFNEVMQQTKISSDEREEIISVLDKIYAIYNMLEEYENAKVAKAVRKKMTSETHMISLVPFIKRAIEEDVSDDIMAKFMVKLFGSGVIVSDEYNDACKGGSAKNVNIVKRNDEINKAWDDFFDSYNDVNDITGEYDDADTDENGKVSDDSNSYMNEPEEIDM